MILSQLAFLNSSERALQAQFTSMNFFWAYWLSGLVLGWYWMASFLYAFLMSSRVAVLGSPSTLQQLLRGLGQCSLKNFSSSSSTIPCSLKNRSKVECASSIEQCLVRSSSQWALLFLSDKTSKASEISLNLASADFLCSLCLSGCHFAASFSQALSISKREALQETPRIWQQFFRGGLEAMGRLFEFDYKGLINQEYLQQRINSRLCQIIITKTSFSSICKCQNKELSKYTLINAPQA